MAAAKKRATKGGATKRQPGQSARSRTREPSLLSQTEERVTRIIDLMERLEWKHSIHVPKLAREWGISESRTEELASEASRHIRGAVRGEPEEIRDELVAALRRVALDAAGGARPDHGARIRAIDSIAELLGLKRHRVEIELDADLDRKLSELQGLVSPEVFHVVTSIFAGKGGQSPPRDGDCDAGGED